MEEGSLGIHLVEITMQAASSAKSFKQSEAFLFKSDAPAAITREQRSAAREAQAAITIKFISLSAETEAGLHSGQVTTQ